jgi:hypothetical protein
MRMGRRLHPLHILLWLACASLLGATSCRKDSVNCERDCGTQAEELLFQTGFEQTTLTNGEYENAVFAGADPSLVIPNDWEGLQAHPKIGFVEIGYESGDDLQRKASITDDPDSLGNAVLQYRLVEPHIREGAKRKGRVQMSLHDNNCISEIYQTVRLKLHPDMAYFEQWSERIYWLTLFEFWNNGAWTKEKNTFRVSVNLFKDAGVGEPLHFRAKSDYQNCRTCAWKEVWGETATAFSLLYGEWMEIELYLKEGDAGDGRFYMAATPAHGNKTVLFDIHNTTQHPDEDCPDGFTHFEPMKMYTSEENIDYMKDGSKEFSIFWDDWRLYLNKQP